MFLVDLFMFIVDLVCCGSIHVYHGPSMYVYCHGPNNRVYCVQHVTDLYHPVRRQTPWVRGLSPVSVNSARWLPDVGEGIVYGTNHGDLHFYRAG